MSQDAESDWVGQLSDSLHICNAVILHGNVNDALPYKGDYMQIARLLNTYLMDHGYQLVGHYDGLDGLGFSDLHQKATYMKIVQAIENKRMGSAGQVGAGYNVPGATPAQSAIDDQSCDPTTGLFSVNSIEFFETFKRIRDMLFSTSCPSAAFIMYYSDRLMGASQQQDLSERTNLILLSKIIDRIPQKSEPPKLLVVVADDIRRVPMDIYYGNAKCRQIHLPTPSTGERKAFIRRYWADFHNFASSLADESVIENLAAYSEGLAYYDLRNLARLSRAKALPVQDGKALVKLYRLGQKQSPWDNLSRQRVLATPWQKLKKDTEGRPIVETVQLSIRECLKERVIGQDEAIEAVEAMIIRAIEGIQSAKPSDALSKPKGVFFFCGPTGVGKTELTKALTEWLFGDKNLMLRFDMSEYKQEHADQKLIGAPPGYVGHEQGGQLTNAVKKKPFSVILFDEVDKMHDRIWDIFLQILDDGRLTDSTGETVYFSETVIVMTSNIGGASHPIGQSLKETKEHYLKAAADFFRIELKRPEILNRIGMDNVIVFNSIDKEFQEAIVWQKLNELVWSYMDKTGLHLDFDNSVITCLLENPEGFMRNGARGVENLLTTHIINPLSRFLFYNPETKSAGRPISVAFRKGDKIETVFS